MIRVPITQKIITTFVLYFANRIEKISTTFLGFDLRLGV